MNRWKLWKIQYIVNKDYKTVNYGASVFSLFTPFFGLIFRHWDCTPTRHCITSDIEFGWQFNFKRILEADSFYKKEVQLVFKEIRFLDYYLERV